MKYFSVWTEKKISQISFVCLKWLLYHCENCKQYFFKFTVNLISIKSIKILVKSSKTAAGNRARKSAASNIMKDYPGGATKENLFPRSNKDIKIAITFLFIFT